MAASIDGYVATHPDQTDAERHQQGFSNEADWQNLLRHIRTCDAVILGSSTLKAGGGVIEQSREDGSYPTWLTLTNRGIPHDHIFWKQSYAERWLVSSSPLEIPDDSRAEKVRNIVYDETTTVHAPVLAAVNSLRDAGCRRVLLLGGGGINRMFYDAGVVDELILTVCPLLVAREDGVPLVQTGLPDLVHFHLHHVCSDKDLVFIHYKVK
ncbi:MAG: dihydrofolate reductase family protein [Bacteroidetes bacterium]|nr:dihydrofolate reductase family protein [Bacteroidota bacterium]MCH8523912.1 dihydrofolate reductase family protein [Balneolales bacterium]